MNKTLQAKHITDEQILKVIDDVRANERRWTHLRDLEKALELPTKILRAKAGSMIRRKVITGCACGCRGDFERRPVALPGDRA
jgi:hypothetical protein